MNILTRGEVGKDRWNAYVDSHMLGWWWQRAEWLDYALAYSPTAKDLSFAIERDSEIVGIVPLLSDMTCGGQVTPAPLLIHDQAVAVCAHEHACDLFGRRPLPIRGRSGIKMDGTAPPELVVDEGATYVVDLRPAEKTLWMNLRKSYKSLINAANRNYDILVYARTWAVGVARDLHIQAAGRETRSRETWQMMAEWAEQGNGLVALARRRGTDSQYAAFAYVIRYKHWSYYASSASLDENVSHALQWQLIQALRAGGALAYEMGYADDTDAKSRGISHFKAGFGAIVMPTYIIKEKPA